MLYRGVCRIDDEKNVGCLRPKGVSAEIAPLFDGSWKLDGTFTLGHCSSNTARAQQIDSGLYGGCGISTSRSEAVAIHFATSGNTEEGFVYVISEAKLEEAGVQAHEFADPVVPREVEVTLISASGGDIPLSVVSEKYAVSSEGLRK